MMDEKTLHAVVKEAVEETLRHVGFTVDAPHQIQADMIYLRKAREGSEEVQKWVRRTAVGVAVSGALFSLWQGIRQSL